MLNITSLATINIKFCFPFAKLYVFVDQGVNKMEYDELLYVSIIKKDSAEFTKDLNIQPIE